MKKKFLLLFLVSFLLFSCNNSQVNTSEEVQLDTIKNVIVEKNSSSSWSEEIEQSILSYDIFEENLKYGNEIQFNYELSYFNNNLRKPVYPQLEDFGSLDVSALPSSVYNNLTVFLSSVVKDPYNAEVSKFDSSYLFSYIFFINEVDSNYTKYFATDKSEEKPEFFTSYIIGQPLFSADVIQIPARLYNKKDFIDIYIFVNNSNSLLYNIDIINWSKK